MKRTFILLLICSVVGVFTYLVYEYFFPETKDCCVGKKIEQSVCTDTLNIERKIEKTNNNK